MAITNSYENLEILNSIIENLTEQVDVMYLSDWSSEKTLKESNLIKMINFLATERNFIENDLHNDDDHSPEGWA